MFEYVQSLTLFDRINLAACAAKRAESNFMDEERYYAEYDTARMWHRNNCYTRTKFTSWVDQ